MMLAYDGRGNEEGAPFLTMKIGAGIRGVCVRYPEQTGPEVVPYPWCIAGDGEDISIVDCLLENPYQGIDVGSRRSPRHFISRVYGYPLRRGILVDQCFDIGRIETYTCGRSGAHARTRAECANSCRNMGKPSYSAMTDWQYVFNTFCWDIDMDTALRRTDAASVTGTSSASERTHAAHPYSSTTAPRTAAYHQRGIRSPLWGQPHPNRCRPGAFGKCSVQQLLILGAFPPMRSGRRQGLREFQSMPFS